MSKPCSPKSKYVNNPQYECGPNGRYRVKSEFKKKRMPSGYNLYTKAQYHIIKNQLINQLGKKPSLGEVSRMLGQQWKKMKKAEKMIYVKEAASLKTQLGGGINYVDTDIQQPILYNADEGDVYDEDHSDNPELDF